MQLTNPYKPPYVQNGEMYIEYRVHESWIQSITEH